MKKKVVILIFFVFLFTSCDLYANHRPIVQDGTFWISESPEMYFVVDQDIDCQSKGIFFDESIIEFKLVFEGDWTGIFDSEKEKLYSLSESWLFKGNYKYSKKKFTITVTSSQIDFVNIGDEIVFHRVEELPEWARELEEAEE